MLKPGDPLPPFELPSDTGETFSPQALKGAG